MWPSIRDWFVNFFTNKTYFEAKWDRWVNKARAATMLLGAGIAIPGGLGDKIQTVIPPKYQPYVGILIMAASLLMRAGDKTPENIKAMSQAMTASAAANAAPPPPALGG